jgi:uncharacterized membrane protein YfcA
MIANSYNVLLGLALVYVAVLQPSIAERRPALLLIAAVTMFVAAWVARRSDHHRWQNNVNLVLAALLGAESALRLEHVPQAAFWSQFSIGILIAILAMWAALYRPTSPPSGG